MARAGRKDIVGRVADSLLQTYVCPRLRSSASRPDGDLVERLAQLSVVDFLDLVDLVVEHDVALLVRVQRHQVVGQLLAEQLGDQLDVAVALTLEEVDQQQVPVDGVVLEDRVVTALGFDLVGDRADGDDALEGVAGVQQELVLGRKPQLDSGRTVLVVPYLDTCQGLASLLDVNVAGATYILYQKIAKKSIIEK